MTPKIKVRLTALAFYVITSLGIYFACDATGVLEGSSINPLVLGSVIGLGLTIPLSIYLNRAWVKENK